MDAEEEVARIVRQRLRLPPDYPLSDGLNLSDELGADSILIMGMLVRIEEVFAIEFTAESVTASKTIGDLVKEVERARDTRTPESFEVKHS